MVDKARLYQNENELTALIQEFTLHSQASHDDLSRLAIGHKNLFCLTLPHTCSFRPRFNKYTNKLICSR